MKIIIINGSYRKNGATALILHEMYQKLGTYPNVEIQFYNVADLNFKYCVGCCKCYENGKCIFNDDIENLSKNIETADGIIIGSPTYVIGKLFLSEILTEMPYLKGFSAKIFR